MTQLNIPSEITSQLYTVTSAQTVFTFTFAVFTKADLHFSVNGVELTQADFSLSGTLLSGGGYQGGTVTLNVAVTGAACKLWRQTVAYRPSNFGPVPTVAVRDIDGALNRLTAMVQDTQQNGANITVNPTTIIGGGASTGGYPPLLSTLGTIDSDGVTTTHNDATFALAEADARLRWALPAGIYKTTRTESQLTKSYEGEGTILCPDGNYLPGHSAYQAVKPTVAAGLGPTGWFRGDQRFTDGGEWKVIGPGVREYDLSSRYFEPTSIPHHAWFDNYSGSSGMLASLAVAITTPTGSATLNAAYAGLVGQTIGLTDVNGTLTDTITVDTVVGNVITFHPNTTVAHPLGSNVMSGYRTWNGHTYIRVQASGNAYGDTYGHIVRATIGVDARPGQNHPFQVATVGQYGGDLFIQKDMNYATCWESQIYDQASDTSRKDVFAIAFVQSLNRGNDVAAHGQNWLGSLFKSEGPCYVDAGHSLRGKFRNGLDVTGADLAYTDICVDPVSIGASTIHVANSFPFRVNDTIYLWDSTGTVVQETIAVASMTYSSNFVGLASPTTHAYVAGQRVSCMSGGGAVNMALGQRIYWNTTTSTTGRGANAVYGAFFGNTPGALIEESASDSGGPFWRIGWSGDAPNNSRLTVKPSIINVRGGLNISGGINCAGVLSTGDISVVANQFLWIDPVGGSALQFNSAFNQIRLWKNNVVVATW